MTGTRWWVEGDIKGFFDNMNRETLLRILGKRITDQRFLHLIGQLLKAGYVEDWRYHHTYSGVPQGGLCKALHNPPYAKQVTMQSETRKTGIFGHFQLHSFA